MIVSYSTLNRFETPKLTLCSPGSVYNDGLLTKVVGILTDVSDMEIVFNFNSTSELNFRVSRVHRDDAEANAHTYALYKAIQNRRLLFVDNIGYFMITNIEDGYDGSLQYKDVKAQSIDVEIQQKMVPYIPDGTYRFSTDEITNTKGLIETIVETLPIWTIAHVDDAVASKFRTFEDVDTSLNCLGFMLNNMQDAYECIFVFDPVHREISVYDQANYVRQTDIHITKDDIINSLNITENADDLYTAISVLGDENVTISAINPIGSNVVYNFDYYLDWMTPSLKEKVIAWQDAVEAEKPSYYNLNLNYYTALAEASNYQLEMQRLNKQIVMYQRCRDNIVAESNTSLVDSYNTVIVNYGGTPVKVYEEIGQTLAEISDLIDECQGLYNNASAQLEVVNADITTYRNQIEEVHQRLAIVSYFNDTELEELTNYIFEGSYTDEYVTITDIMSYEEKFDQMKILYDRAQSRLERVSQPTQEFDIDAENFIFVKDFEHWSEQLETGCLINAELDVDDMALLFLSNITVNYEDHSLNMTFGNRFNKFDPKSLFDDVLGDISKSANTLNYLKEILYPIKHGEFNAMKEALETSRNLTMSGALSSDNEEVVIDGSGYTGRKLLDNGTYDPRQVKITGKTIVFTDDAWESCKVAIGEFLLGNGESMYGVNAQAIIGDIIMGNNLHIVDNNGNDLLDVVDGKVTSTIYGEGEEHLLPDGTKSIYGQMSSIKQTVDAVDITFINNLKENGVDVDHVYTKTGYRFDKDGLYIFRDGESVINELNHAGMYVKRKDDGNVDEPVLTADKDGVNALNLTARQYLIIGENSRFEDYSNGTDDHRTACFYVGG